MDLPIWIEYVKVIGTPVVALVAAVVAGGISYRQWSTARKKLKFDLFEKRFHVYEDAAKLITLTAGPEPVEWDKIVALTASFSSARWLFDSEISSYLARLEVSAALCLTKEPLDPNNIPEEEKLAWLLKMGDELIKERNLQIVKLDALFERYLIIEH